MNNRVPRGGCCNGVSEKKKKKTVFEPSRLITNKKKVYFKRAAALQYDYITYIIVWTKVVV